MKAFVAGGTGFLGKTLIRSLIDDGHSIRALVRSVASAKKKFSGQNVEFVEGDMGNVEGFASSLIGCNVLFHTADSYKEYFDRKAFWDELESINVTGTLKLMEAAKSFGLIKAIYVGASGVLSSNSGRPTDETAPASQLVNRNLYFRSKMVCEQRLRTSGLSSSLPIVHILPGWILGPGDETPSQGGQFILDFLERRIPASTNGGTSIVDVRDVAQSLIAAADKGRAAESYVVGGHYVDFTDLLRELESLSGIRGPRFRVPNFIAMAGAHVWQKLSVETSAMSVEGLRIIQSNLNLPSRKAENELGISFRPLQEALSDEIRWFRAQSLIH